jgi:hypothetical protein
VTIHWNALEEHFLMVPLVFRFNHFWGKNAFSEFFSIKNSVIEEFMKFGSKCCQEYVLFYLLDYGFLPQNVSEVGKKNKTSP